jgi:hypothetical protein
MVVTGTSSMNHNGTMINLIQVLYIIFSLSLVGALYIPLRLSLQKYRFTNKRHVLTVNVNLVVSSNNGSDGHELHDSQRRSLIQNGSSMLIGTAVASTTALLNPEVTSAAQPLRRNEFQYLIPTPRNSREFSWPLGKVAFSLLPLAGTSTRRVTLEQEIVPDTIWTHDQIQGIVNVHVPVRQTVIKLRRGGLWVHNPVAPTPQLIKMIRRLEEQHGSVKHIVLGTVALEHKATFAAFASYFPKATVWLQPGQWSFPVSVPIEFYGLVQGGSRLREIPMSESLMPTMIGSNDNVRNSSKQAKYSYYAKLKPIPEWAEEIEYEILGPFQFKSVGGFSETAFYHTATKSLIVTDCVVTVTKNPPPIIAEDPRALLYHSRDKATEVILEDTPARREKGWRRMVQFGLVFFPSQITVTPTLSDVYNDAVHVPANLRNLGDGAIPLSGSLYPWSWHSNDADQMNFDYISQHGKLFCPPILTKLILDREPFATLDFVDRVCTRFRDMKRIIPCHLNNDIQVKGSKEFYDAFEMLRSQPNDIKPQRALAEDLALLQQASDLLTRVGIVGPSVVCDGEPARRIGRFAKLQ